MRNPRLPGYRSVVGLTGLVVATAVLGVSPALAASNPASGSGASPLASLLSAATKNAAQAVTPAEGSDNGRAPEFLWVRAGGSNVDHQVLVVDGAAVDNDIDPTRYWSDQHLDPGTHTWRVDTVYNDGTVTASNTVTFTVAHATYPAAGPSVPAEGSDNGRAPEFLWVRAGGSNVDHQVLVVDGAAVDNDIDPTRYWSDQHLDPGTHTWRIDTVYNDGTVSASKTVTFTVDKAHPAATLNAPQEGSDNGRDPLFDWTAASDASPNVDHQVLLIDGQDSGDSLTAQDDGDVQHLAPGTHTWRVDTVYNDGTVSASKTVTFTVDKAHPAAGPSVPAEGSDNGQAPEFLWDVAGGSNVDHQVLVVDDVAVDNDIDPTQYWSDQHLAPGTHTWRVDTVYNDGAVSASKTVTFTVARAAYPAAQLGDPAEGSLSGTEPLFTWTAASDASPNVDHQVLLIDGQDTGDSLTAQDYGDVQNLAPGVHTWRVDTVYKDGTVVASDTATFTVGGTAN